MSLTKEEIEGYYSRAPLLSPPPQILLIKNASIGAERLYHATHALNSERWNILGMHQMGTDSIVIAGNAKESTPIHEAVHYQGVRNEVVTRFITRVLQTRMQFNLGLLRRPVHYEEEPVPPAETAQILHDLHLDNPSGESVHLVRLVYRP